VNSPALRALTLGPCLGLMLGGFTPVLAEDDRRRDAGFRLNVIGGTGKPTNDVLGFGVFGRYRLDDRWAVGLGIDVSGEFDIERTPELVGLVQDPDAPVVDSRGSSEGLSAWVERGYGDDDRRLQWFWTVGAGVNSVDVEDQAGPLAGGGTFDVAIDAGTEWVVSASLGLRVRLGERFLFEPAVRLDQHFADWKLTDRVSGATASIDDYLLRGVHLAFAYRF
jgi:hypothetical protein